METNAGAPDPFSAESERDPYPIYKILRDEYPVLWHEGAQAYFVSRYEDVARIYKETGTNFSPQPYDEALTPVWGPTPMHLDGAYHAALRRVIQPVLRGDYLEEHVAPVIERATREAIEGFASTGEVELVGQFTTVMPLNVVLLAQNLPKEDFPRIWRWYNAAMDFFENVLDDPEIREAGLRAAKEIEEYILPFIRERRERPGDDWISRLCTAVIDGKPISDDEVRGFAVLLWSAGAETSDKGLASLFKNLLEHPDQLEGVRADRSLITRAFAETLRYTNPVRMNPRRALRDVELSGTVIEEGKLLFAMIGAANRDERKFKDPERFDIFRDDLDCEMAWYANADILSFGKGAHHCLGSWVAKAEAEIATNLLLDAMPDVRFKDGFVPTETGVVLRGPRTLELIFTPTGG